MTKQELVKEIRKPGPVLVGVNWTDDDIVYIEAKKQDLLEALSKLDDDTEMRAERMTASLYIN